MNSSKKKWLYVAILFIALFAGTSAIQVPRDVAFTCYSQAVVTNPANVALPVSSTSHRLEYGLPLAFIKRSVSPSLCMPKHDPGYKLNNSVSFWNEYGGHKILVVSFIVDAVLWFLVAFVIVRFVAMPRKRKQK